MIRLVPKQATFFDLFEKQAKTVCRGANFLEALLQNFINVEDYAFKIKTAESDGDEIVHQIMNQLNSTFVTPIDREDIHDLASALDDILDYIEAGSDRLMLYEITEPTESAIKLSKILSEATAVTVQAVGSLRDMRDPKHIRELCIEVNQLENQGDKVNRAALAKLFNMHDQPIEALKWREIYDHIETAIDKCEDVADIVESIVMKNC